MVSVYTIIKSHDPGIREEPAKFATPLSYPLGHHDACTAHCSREPPRARSAATARTPDRPTRLPRRGLYGHIHTRLRGYPRSDHLHDAPARPPEPLHHARHVPAGRADGRRVAVNRHVSAALR